MSSEISAPAPGRVFWLCGLSGAGKSTLATGLAAALRARGLPVLALDGDILRTGLCAGLGFSPEGRAENLRRAAEVARLGVASGLTVVAAFITPLEENRRRVTGLLGPGRCDLIHVDAPVEVCRARDVKGLYAAAAAGRVAQLTGVAAAFERPTDAALTLATSRETPAASAARLLAFALARLDPPA